MRAMTEEEAKEVMRKLRAFVDYFETINVPPKFAANLAGLRKALEKWEMLEGRVSKSEGQTVG